MIEIQPGSGIIGSGICLTSSKSLGYDHYPGLIIGFLFSDVYQEEEQEEEWRRPIGLDHGYSIGDQRYQSSSSNPTDTISFNR